MLMPPRSPLTVLICMRFERGGRNEVTSCGKVNALERSNNWFRLFLLESDACVNRSRQLDSFPFILLTTDMLAFLF